MSNRRAAIEDERLLERIREVHRANYEAYGYRRTWKALLRAGERVPRCQVQRLMREHGIRGAKRRGRPWRTTTPDPHAQRPADLVERDFTAEAPDRLWVCDFTRLRCWDGVVYFAFVIDVFSRRVVGWQLAGHMRSTLVLDALRMALARRRPGADVALVAHSDAGSQYTSCDYTQTLDDHGVLASIGTVGDALDNALAESFVDSFKTELISDRVCRRGPGWSSRSSSTSPGSTTTACTAHSATSRPPSSRLYTLRGTSHPPPLSRSENQQSRSPSDPVRLRSSPSR